MINSIRNNHLHKVAFILPTVTRTLQEIFCYSNLFEPYPLLSRYDAELQS